MKTPKELEELIKIQPGMYGLEDTPFGTNLNITKEWLNWQIKFKLKALDLGLEVVEQDNGKVRLREIK